MVLTAGQTQAFFEDAAQMGIPHSTVIQLRAEGIQAVGDLVDFDKDTLQQIADNLRRPGGRIPDPAPNAPEGATIPTPPFVFGAKSQKRLLVACDLVRFYETVGRDLTPGNIIWNTVMRNFSEQWKAIKTRKSEDDPDVPKISKALPIIKWTEAFQDYLARVIGVRLIPLSYVIREDETPPAMTPPLMAGQPHSIEHGSVEGELIARASHNHALFRDDNATVYYKLEEATRSTSYADSIKPFQRTKNGRAAWLALTSQYAGDDKWEAEIKRQDDLLHTRIWKGQSNFTLEKFIQQHRSAYVSMEACAQHIDYQLPNQHTRVGYLLEAIQCDDAGLQAAMASVRVDKEENGKRSNFEATASHLLPYDPVAKRRSTGTKRGAANISDTSANVAAFGAKSGIGKSGVHLRYHKPTEYKTLSKEQKDELREWRKSKGGGKDGGGNERSENKRNKRDKAIAAAVSKQVEKQLSEKSVVINESKNTTRSIQDDVTDDEARAYIMSLLSEKKAPTPAATVQSVTLKSILRRVRNNATAPE